MATEDYVFNSQITVGSCFRSMYIVFRLDPLDEANMNGNNDVIGS